MKRFLIGIFATFLFVSSAFAQFVQVPPFGAGQIPGTTTNDNASSGNVGEFLFSSCPGGSPTTVTITIATPGVVTYTGHGFINANGQADACPIVFTNSGGALPTGIVSGTTYWTVPSSLTTNTFQFATTVANAVNSVSVNTSGSQSGTQSATKGVALTTATAANITGLLLTAGDWDCRGFAATNPNAATTSTSFFGWLSATSAVFPTAPFNGALVSNAFSLAAGGTYAAPVGILRQSLSASTPTYLSMQTAFAINSDTGYGFHGCRRVR